MTRITPVLLLPVVLFAGACSSSSVVQNQPDSSLGDANVADTGTNPDGGGRYLPAGYSLVPFLSDTATTHTFSKADQVIDASKDYVAVIDTSVGRVVIHLLATDTPITINSFVFLALHHYFDGIAFHRVIDGFMAQTGDPNTLKADQTNWGTGGPGYQFALEVKPSLNFDGPGVVGMARTAQPNTNGSQFFIVFDVQASLNQQYTVFGKVIEGLDILPAIVRGGPQGTTFPSTGPTRMTDVYIGAK